MTTLFHKSILILSTLAILLVPGRSFAGDPCCGPFGLVGAVVNGAATVVETVVSVVNPCCCCGGDDECDQKKCKSHEDCHCK